MQDLSLNNRRELLALARQSIETFFSGEPVPEPKDDSPELTQSAGCFVTLRDGRGALRGCVGTFDREDPLVEHVVRMARAAAFQDTRFPALTRKELVTLRIEISVLGENRRVAGIEEVETGRHGVLIRSGQKSGTYLPDVAVEQGWSREEFVMHCAREKAGLSPSECAAAEIYVYEVIKFKEESP